MPEGLDKTLTQLLERELQHARQLAQVLESEQEALDQRDQDRIEQAAATKREAVEALETLERERRQLLQTQGLDPDDMETATAQGGAPHLAEQWQALVSVIAQCQRHNQANGAVIDASQRRVREALGILRGDAADQGIYGPGGQTTEARHGSRTIDQA